MTEMSSVLSKGPHILDAYDSIISTQLQIIANLTPDQRDIGFAMIEDDMRSHIEFMWNVVNTVEGVPIEYIELCLMMDNLMKALYGSKNIEILSGGKSKRTNKCKRTRKHRVMKHGGTRRNTKVETVERTWSLMSSIGSKLVYAVGVGLATAAGISTSYSAVNEVAYYTSKTHEGLKSLLPEFIIGQQPIHRNAIPEPLMNLAVDYNYEQIHKPAVPISLNADVSFVLDREYLELLQENSADTFASHITDVLGDPILTQDFPKIRQTVSDTIAKSSSRLTTCETSKSVLQFWNDPCKIEKAQHDLEKEQYKVIETLGYKLTPGDSLQSTHYELQPATIGLADGIRQVLNLQGDTESAKSIDNMLTTFKGYEGIGLAEGSGRFAPNLLLTIDGIEKAKTTCMRAVRNSKCSGDFCDLEDNSIVSKIENLLVDVCDMQVNVYAQKAYANNIARKEGDKLVHKIASIEDSKQKGFSRMIQYFETKQLDVKTSSNERDIYGKIVQDLHFMNIKNIMFPTDPTMVSTWINVIESHYKGYIRAGVKNVETLSTREFFNRLHAKNIASTWTVQLAGAFAGSLMFVALSGLIRAAWYGLTGTVYAAGAVGQFMKNLYDAQVQKGALADQMYKVQKHIIEKARSPEDIAKITSMLSGNIQRMKMIDNVRNTEVKPAITNVLTNVVNNVSGGYRTYSRRRSTKKQSYKRKHILSK